MNITVTISVKLCYLLTKRYRASFTKERIKAQT